MRVLSIHNRYKIRGGEDECFEAEAKLLREYGHKVYEYVEDNQQLEHLPELTKVRRTLWSKEAYGQVSQYLEAQGSDVVHVHNFLPLISPSVYYAAQSRKVPVVQTLHNYRLLCPNALFFKDGKECTNCLGKAIPWPGVWHGCYRESRVASGITAAMLSLHRALKTWQNSVDCYITLTEFARQQFIKGGLPPEKIVVKPNFVHPDPGIGTGKGGYALFVGRLSVEKGIDTLLAAWQLLDSSINLKIVGDGPLAEDVKTAAQSFKNIEWLGHRPLQEVYDLIGEAMFLVFPSKWYETFGRVAIEAFAKGTPVIASKIGAIEELVDSGRTGFLFQPGNPHDLTQAANSIIGSSNLNQMRQEARREFERKYTAEMNYQSLISIYKDII